MESLIPEGATHFAVRNDRQDMANPFRKFDEGVRGCFFVSMDREWKDLQEVELDIQYRPISEHPHYVAPAPAWDGQGLPPVGTVCEVLWNDARKEYTTCIVVGVEPETGNPVFRFTGKYKTNQYQSDPPKSFVYGTQVFRPIRTAEQIARDEGVKRLMAWAAATGARAGGKSHMPFEPFWSNAYDCGLRAPE